MLGFSTSFGFLDQNEVFELLSSISGSLGRGRMSTGRTASGLPRFEVRRRGGAGGFSSSSELIFLSDDDDDKGFFAAKMRLKTYEDKVEVRIHLKVRMGNHDFLDLGIFDDFEIFESF